MDIVEVMRAEKEAIEREIRTFLRKERVASLEDPIIGRVLDAIEEYTLRNAKRVRSILTVMGYRSVGGEDLERIRKASVALEMIQTMLLIHDDIIDRSHTRRGKPTMHLLYSGVHEKEGYLGDPERFGVDMAIIAGDLAESFGEKALLESGFPVKRVLDALRCQTEMIRDTGYGQILDLYSVELPRWTEEMVMKVHKYKTARYTLDAPLRIGALLHGATPEQLGTLSEYAIPVGVSFQLIDDILGFFGDPRRGGKEDLSDIKEGKRTMLIIKAIERSTPEQRKMITEALGNPDLSVEQAEGIREIIRSTGSEEYSREMAREKTDEGIRSLKEGGLDAEVTLFLESFARLMMGRA